MKLIESFTQSKSTTITSSEDAMVVTPYYAAVIDGATPKTAFRFPSGETPGQVAARRLSEAIATLPPSLHAREAIDQLSAALRNPEVAPSDHPTASIVIYSAQRREVWRVGDCQFATIAPHLRTFPGGKQIDQLFAQWRRSVIRSYLDRGLMTPEAILDNDPGRRIIQPFITRQVRYQNLDSSHPLAFGAMDGQRVPDRFIEVHPLSSDIHELILASDGYPEILPTLSTTEARLQHCLLDDPLCIGPLLGTKALLPGNLSFDDRTYLRLQL